MRPRRLPGGDAALLFVCLWLAFGATITKWNLYDFTLQHAVVESLVERGTFEVGGSKLPILKDAGDKFLYEGRWLPAKQPGQFAAGAPIYFLCTLAGITYAGDYLLAASLVTWFTASLISAAGCLFFFKLVTQVWRFPRRTGWFATLCYALATNIFPYSGIAHHDVIAVSYLLGALYLVEASHVRPGESRIPAFIAGLLLGLALFTSMLPAILVAVLIAYAVLTRPRSFTVLMAAGTVAGLLPLAAYNGHYFGNPFVQSNMAGGFRDTYFTPDLARFLDHLNVYFGAGDLTIIKYMPVVLLGAAGGCLMGGELRRRRTLLVSMMALHAIYVLNIPAIGYCQYGPRFLIPMVAAAMLGLPALVEWVRIRSWAPWGAFAVALVAIYSFVVNLTGSLVGTMFCEIQQFAFAVYLRMPLGAQLDSYPLAIPCLSLLMVLASAGIARLLLATR